MNSHICFQIDSGGNDKALSTETIVTGKYMSMLNYDIVNGQLMVFIFAGTGFQCLRKKSSKRYQIYSYLFSHNLGYDTIFNRIVDV